MEELEKLIDMIEDEELRKLVKEFVSKPDTKLGEAGFPLEEGPGGVSMHHAYPGGLLQHMVATTKIALSLCDVVEEVYGWNVNRDIVIAAAVLHDVGKLFTYNSTEEGYERSDLGLKFDHLTLAMMELYARKFPPEVLHAVLSHHGDQSPTTPKTIEALIVSVADYADSTLNGKVIRAARYLAKKAVEEVELKQLTPEQAYEIIKAKKEQGMEGVKKTVEKLLEAGEAAEI